ncbi:thioesterase II family protein [Microbulbifer epialgicus]|uniref:Thioesterase II family protein n=1 Tax=Microbulbifer epialgicus TaxID=393907 RepID=A0ABV4P5Z6_9GAMM
MSINDWVINLRSQVNPKLRVFCFPYAGGSASIYTKWAEYFPPEVEIVAVQPPGRASRVFEKPYTDMESLVNELFQKLVHSMDIPYIFFGHSLGSRVAFELLNKINEHDIHLPVHFIASGSNPPDVYNKKSEIYRLSDAQFMIELEKFQGTSDEALQSNELMNILLPGIKADFEIANKYVFESMVKHKCDLTVLGGTHDKDVDSQSLHNWSKFFSGSSKVEMIDGDHFFIDSNRLKVVNEVVKIVNEIS